MNIRNFFFLITLSILMVSTKAMSDECVAGSNFFLPAGDSYTLYRDLYQAYNDDLTVCVTHNSGAPVRVEDGDGQELFTLAADSGCAQYQDVDTVKAICEGVGNDDCNISWNICGESPEFAIPDPPTTRPTTIDNLASAENDDDSRLVKDDSRTTDLIVNPCPEGTVLTPYEMPVYDEQGIFVVGYETVWYCIQEDTPIAE